MSQSQVLRVQPTRFINAEPGILPFATGPVPVVLLSFGAEEGLVEDKAVGIIEARQMAMDILESLASLGDPLAQAIGEQFFQGGEEPEFDTGSEYEDECPGCG
jgi:hypothetical protein